MIDPDFIAKLVTDDPDIFNEGWEELGIEDPGVEAKKPVGLNSKDIIGKIQSYFNTNFPDVEYDFMPTKQVDVQTFLLGQYPFSMFISDEALDQMSENRANAFFGGVQGLFKGTGWKMFEKITHNEEEGQLVIIIYPESFRIE